MPARAHLDIKNLTVTFVQRGAAVRAVRGISMPVLPAEIHSLVGESGSGKTVTAQAIMGLLPSRSTEVNGEILLKSKDLLNLPIEQLREIRGGEIGMIFQEPSRYLNPAFTVSNQIEEMIRVHLGIDKKSALEKVGELLSLVGLGGDSRTLKSYPHELSGGMRQRAMIAMAISCGPSLLIADEPTTALDVTVQRQILELILDLRNRLGMSVLFISHDMGVVHEISDRVSVIYLGKIVETADMRDIFGAPLHPYTKLLLSSIPNPERRGERLTAIPGRVPDAEHVPSGCTFHPRCPFAVEICGETEPAPVSYRPRHSAACHRIGDFE